MASTYTLGSLARAVGVGAETVRYYERVGLLVPPLRAANGYRRYDEAALARLRFVRQAAALGFSLAEIADILREAKEGNTPCPMVREIIVRRIAENQRKIKEMQKLQRKMEKALQDWSKMRNSMPTGDSVCHLIESVSDTEK